MTKGPFRGVYAILYTFFNADGTIDQSAMRRQVDACVKAGCHGIAILGIVSEYNKMNLNERRRMLDIVAEALAGRVPLAVTIGEPSVAGQQELAAAAAEAGASWLILQPPPVKGIPEGELLRFFGAVAERASLPVGIQNNPIHLDVWLGDQALKTLNRNHPNVSLLKADVPVTMLQRTIAETEGALDVFCGLAGREMPMCLKAGAVGCVPAPDLVDVQSRIFDLMATGRAEDEREADRLHRQILPLLDFMMQAPEHLLCYGKRFFAKRIGLGDIHPRAPALTPTAFGTSVVDYYAAGIGPLS
jgi:4-hydroxy-tetrahydrodipicolinate synthase